MAERFTADLAFIIIVLLVAAALGFLIGYHVRKAMKCKRCAELEEENDKLRQMISSLESDKIALKHKIDKLEADENELKQRITKLESEAMARAKRRSVKPKKPLSAT
ncbi:MAG: protein bicaudal D homolog [Bacteroidales bacterium]|nr:protein bicaudal D homolog [Bacteroidales bacterium]